MGVINDFGFLPYYFDVVGRDNEEEGKDIDKDYLPSLASLF